MSERTVTNLLDRYDELLAVALADDRRLRKVLAGQGRVILGIDGLQPDVGHEVLWVLRDCLSGEVLLARESRGVRRAECHGPGGHLGPPEPVEQGLAADGGEEEKEGGGAGLHCPNLGDPRPRSSPEERAPVRIRAQVGAGPAPPCRPASRQYECRAIGPALVVYDRDL